MRKSAVEVRMAEASQGVLMASKCLLGLEVRGVNEVMLEDIAIMLEITAGDVRVGLDEDRKIIGVMTSGKAARQLIAEAKNSLPEALESVLGFLPPITMIHGDDDAPRLVDAARVAVKKSSLPVIVP